MISTKITQSRFNFVFVFVLPDGKYIYIKGRDAQGHSRNASAVVESDVSVASGIESHLSNLMKIWVLI